jgi:glucosamine--fructose-6-phosphate aminotransferase (isomerizing)
MPVEEAVSKATQVFEGTWGLCVMDRENPQILIAAKNGSPMLIGLSDGRFDCSLFSSLVNI